MTIELRVNVERDAGGQPIAVEIDKTFHDSAVVGPGDRVEWVCSNCPEGTEFAVENLHFAGDLDRLVDMFSETEGRDERQQLSRTLQAQRASLEEPLDQQARQEQEVLRLVSALKTTLAPDPSHPLFGDWSPPSRFVPANEAIPSPRAVLGVGDGFWKFTWKVRLTGDRASERSWDPCIYGHRPPPGT
ncbi:MAG: hypothetical protein ACRDHY_07075 [Anaerolineales bacterium]